MNEQLIIKEDNPIVLKELVAEDAELYYALIEANREYFANFGNMDPNKYTTVQSVRDNLLQPGTKQGFGIYDTDKELIGIINIVPILHAYASAEIGYLIGKDFSRKGYATKAALALIELSKKLGYKHLEAFAHEENYASQKVLIKAGFTPERKPIIPNDDHIEFNLDL